MSNEKGSTSFKAKLVFPVVVALLAGGSSPWWVSKVFPSPNSLPVATAGNDQSIQLPQNSATLDGTGSSDKDGQIRRYLWTKKSGPSTFNITDPNVARTPVTGLVAGDYIFELTVTDDAQATATALVTITVKASAPMTSRYDKPWPKTFTLFGQWGSGTPGDNDMDTDPGDVVSVFCRTELSFSASDVTISIRYKIVEDGGDHTTFDETVTRTVFVPNAGDGRIVDVRAAGGRFAEFNETSRGQNHVKKSFRTDGTYWDDLKFRVDGPGYDNNTIGVEGKLNITIVLER